MHSLDIIIPVKNEAENIPSLVDRIHGVLTKSGICYQLIFIDDRSTDNTISQLEKLTQKYPIKYTKKRGKPGKAWSILEGADLATSLYVAMLDADLQYPPEVLPQMFKKAETHGVVVANRKIYRSTLFRRFASRFNAFVCGRLLFGLGVDVQSGLKIFRREILTHVDRSVIKPWSIDIPLLVTCLDLGHTIGSVEIVFDTRTSGNSKIRFWETATQIVSTALHLRLRRKSVYELAATGKGMIGSGVVHHRRRYITHTTLPFSRTAAKTFTFAQLFFLTFCVGLIAGGLILFTKNALIALVAILSTIYFLDVIFSLYVTLKSLHFPPEIQVSSAEITKLESKILPVYTILCPLYREAHILPQFIDSIDKLAWPKHRLEVLLLLEEDDRETIYAAKKMKLPGYVNILVVPDSLPKTKPKALNYGLSHANGTYIVVFDAEDQPDPNQLKNAYLAFQKTDKRTVCLQAKLNYYNPHYNLLTRLFTTEYSLWFDMILPGLQAIETAIPLGGTSNHFRTADLKKLHGWDAFNVTEDADLGARLFKSGYKTAIIDSTTLEEANSNFVNWVRQRSRWLKGYLQTYFVHMRHPVSFIRDLGIHAFIFQLVMGGKIAFMLINPILWLLTIAYFMLYRFVGPAIESLYPGGVFYMAATSLVAGNFLYIYNYMIGTAKRGHWNLVKFVYLVPFYWLMISGATVIAVIQLFLKPHYWEKTHHGLHLSRNLLDLGTPDAVQKTTVAKKPFSLPRFGLVTSGLVLTLAAMAGNVFNFLYNAYLGREISLAEYGTVSLFGSLLYLAQIPLGALSKTVTWKTAFLSAKHSQRDRDFWFSLRRNSQKIGFVLSGLWLIFTPVIAAFFHIESVLPIALFAPVWAIGCVFMTDMGYFMGKQNFLPVALVVITEAFTKFILTLIIVKAGLPQFVYAAIPLSMLTAFLLGRIYVKSDIKLLLPDQKTALAFPKRFFTTDIFMRASTAAFISADLILAKHYLSAEAAGEYGLLTLPGKMIFFATTLVGQFIVPAVTRDLGKGKNSPTVFYKFLAAQTLVATMAFLVVGLFGYITVPYLLGTRALAIVPYLPVYGLAMVYFTTSSTLVTYHQIRKEYVFSLISLLTAVLQVGGLITNHNDISTFIRIIFVSSAISMGLAGVLHALYGPLSSIFENLAEFFRLFDRIPQQRNLVPDKLRILIFNWRDTKHKWAGGAEVYLHELAKRWVTEGHRVTVFCGNDRKNPRNEVVDGVQVVRRGGFYLVYFWAFLYYILRFRRHFDVVIDSENGVPFFTPLYIGKPKFLLIHHIHQDVFQAHLAWPLSTIAKFIESRLMPLIYKNQKIITVSASSKADIISLGLGNDTNIDIVNPGIDASLFVPSAKTVHPQFLYLGRLKAYKNISVLVSAFVKILSEFPTARLIIAGEGEELAQLTKLVTRLGLTHAVKITGKVSPEEKTKLLAESWALVQPSSFEGWGITVIEANASGTPVIAANVAGLKDSVVHNETGILVPPKNVTALARIMSLIVSRPKWRVSLSSDAYEWSKEFSWDKSARKFHEVIIKELASKQRYPYYGKIAFSKR